MPVLRTHLRQNRGACRFYFKVPHHGIGACKMVQPTQPDYPAGNSSGFATPRSRQFSRLREKSMYIRSRFGFAIPRTGYSEHPPEARMARGLAMQQSVATTESSHRIRAAFALGLLGLLAVGVPDRQGVVGD